jgi:hypothetical protein
MTPADAPGVGGACRPVPTIAVLGLGEAGSRIAADLVAAGAIVHAFDPKVPAPASTQGFGSDAGAARGATVVLALTSAHEALETLELALPGIVAGAIYADLNTGSAGLKSRLAAAAGGAGVAFVDVALMAPVPGLGLRTPMPASGSAAGECARILGSLGADVTILGCEDWLRADIGQVLAEASADTVDRLEHGSVRHARRRVEEMKAAGDLLDELGVPSRVARASQDWLEQLVTEADEQL